MPWKAAAVSDLRLAFIHQVRELHVPLARAARAFGISRKSAYKWLARFDAGHSTADGSRRPHASPMPSNARGPSWPSGCRRCGIAMAGAPAHSLPGSDSTTTRPPPARPPRGREEVPVQIDRLLEAHEIIFKEARALCDQADDNGDQGTNDLMASKLIPTTEMQVWFVSEHVVDVPTVRAE